jgi:hypothetical protein
MTNNYEQLKNNNVFFLAWLAGMFLATPSFDAVVNHLPQVLEDQLAQFASEMGCDSVLHQALDLVQRIRLLLPTPSMFALLCAGNVGFQNFYFMQGEASLGEKQRDIYKRVGALIFVGVVTTVSAYVHASTMAFYGILTLFIFMTGSLIALVRNPTRVINEDGEGNHLRVMVTWFAWAVALNAAVELTFEDSLLVKLGRFALGCALAQALCAFVFLGGFVIDTFTPSADE